NHKVPRTGVAVSLLATDASGERWYFDVAGAFTSYRGGLLRMDAVWKALGRAHALRGQVHRVPLVLLATHLPRRPSEGDTTLRAAGPDAFYDVIDLQASAAQARLGAYGRDGAGAGPAPGFRDVTVVR